MKTPLRCLRAEFLVLKVRYLIRGLGPGPIYVRYCDGVLQHRANPIFSNEA